MPSIDSPVVSELTPLGVQITGLHVRDVDAATARRLALLLAEHGVAVLRDQHVDDDQFATFLRHFGTPAFTAGEPPVAGHPDLNVVSNIGRTVPPRSVFHVDTSYVSRPPAYTALRAVQVPASGGQTTFSNQYRAYDTLDEALRGRLAGRSVRHVVSGVDPGDTQQREARHPLFRSHPLTGKVALYLSTPQRCVAVSGLDDAEAADLIARLYEHSTAEHNVYRHTWAPGDVVIWDNSAVMHRADHNAVVGERVLHRGMASGFAGPASADPDR